MNLPYRKCCEPECTQKARWQLWWGKTADDFTEACSEHMGELADAYDKNDYGVSRIQEEKNEA